MFSIACLVNCEQFVLCYVLFVMATSISDSVVQLSGRSDSGGKAGNYFLSHK